MENKKSYFYIDLPIVEGHQENPIYKRKVTNSIDLVLSVMKVTNDSYRFENKTNGRILQFFKTEDRKRNGQLDKFCKRYIPTELNQEMETGGITKDQYNAEIMKFERNKNYVITEKPSSIKKEYLGKDIEIFNDRQNWRKWQVSIYNKIFDENNSFKEPDPRKIINLLDKKGCSGKSSFFKWLFFKYPKDIGRLGYGTAAQLRSSVLNLGAKQLYIIDLPRSKGRNDRQEDLLSVVKDIKTGLIINAMGNSLIMEPPHIIISSSYELDYKALSKDRWDIYEIKSNTYDIEKIDIRKV